MSQRFLFSLIAGVAVAAALFIAVLAWRGGDRLEPTGQILKLRSIAADTARSIVVLDLRIVNASNIALEVRQAGLSIESASGRKLEGTLVSGVDTRQLFAYFPALGEAYNEPLIAGSRIAPHRTVDFMLAARVDMPEQEISSRRKLTVSVQDRSGLTFVLSEKGR